MAIDLSKLSNAVENCVQSIDELYGHYLDTTSGFQALHKKLAERVGADGAGFFYGVGPPTDPKNRVLHKTTIGEAKQRNQPDGSNSTRAGQLLLVLLYSFWEGDYRPRLADALELSDANQLKVPAFGDVRLLRVDVVHHNAVVSSETVRKLEVFKNFQLGAPIVLKGSDVENLIRTLKEALDVLVIDAGGVDPKHSTVLRMDGPVARPSEK